MAQFFSANNVRMTVEVRTATAEDEPFLWDMLYLAVFVPPGTAPPPRGVLWDPALARYVHSWGKLPGDRGLLALANGVAVGAAWLRLFPASDPGYGFVDASTPELSAAILPP